ncbi:MAG: methyltransferase domain-containing protein [bacterium]|nr:methyltransferase domain-containing protein [candidate division KSB1 bacterium]MDH7559430.1 methyltransferase domain-containing protein [bacterium]
MDFFSIVAPVYDRLIPVADLEALRRHLRLPCAGLLLDVGGGTGRISHGFAGYVGGAVVVDRSLAMVRRVPRGRRVWAVVADAARLPFRPATFARVLAVDALHHFAAQELAINELAAVLGGGGRLVIEEPDISRLAIKCLAVGERLLGMRSGFLPGEKLASLLSSQGLDVTVVRGRSFVVWVNGDKEEARGEILPGRVSSDH